MAEVPFVRTNVAIAWVVPFVLCLVIHVRRLARR
jgi:hypothetical protein